METSGVHRRCPALLAALCLGLGIVCSEFLAPPTWLWLTSAGIFWVVVLLLYLWGTAARIASWMLCISLFGLGGIRHHQDTRLLPANDIRQAHVYGSKGELTASLDHDPETLADGRRRVRVRAEILCADDGDCRELSGDVLLTVRPEVTQFTATAGDRLRILCRILKPQPARNPGEFDYRRFLAQRHDLHATASIYRNSDILEMSPGSDTPWQQHVIRPIRASLRSSFTAHLDGAPAALLVGMLLGDKHAIPASVASQFRATGLAHALVISGLHVGLIVIFLLTLMRVARVPDAIACSATVVLLVIYAFVTQMQAPVVRASLMAAIVLVGRAVELRGSVLNSLGLAALVLMVVQPTSLLTLSFQLSFAATLAIVTLHGPFMSLWPSHWLAETSRVGKWILVPATVSLAAQVGTLPLIVFHFQQLAPLSLLANLLVVPLLGLAVAQGLLLALVAPIVPAAAPMISGAIWLTLTGLMKIVAVFSALTPWQVAQPTPSEALSWMSLTALTIVAIYRPGLRRVSLLLALLTANVWIWHKVWDPAVLDIVFLDVGQGDAAFVRFPDGKTMIIDAGMRSRHIDMGERVVVPWLRRQGVEVVDVVVASHPHADHIGGLVSLLEQIKVRHFVDGGQNYDSWTSLRLRQLIERRQITYHAVRGGDSLAGLGGAGGLILHPTASFVDSSGLSTMGLNNGSVVFRLDYGERRVLFTGDIEHETDRSVTRWGSRLHADILKVAHHGSRTSSAAVFLDVVRPSVAVISVGAHNKFRHPASPVVTRLQAHADVRRTDQDGAIMIRISNTGQMRVSQQLTDDPGHRSVDKSRPSR